MTIEEHTHTFRAEKLYAVKQNGHTYKEGGRIEVTAELHYIQGNSHPYFSVTADIRERGGYEGGGCCHDEILKYWPELAPVIALHLSDDNGQPMHAEANGWYWLAGYYSGAGDQYHGGSSQGHFGGEYRLPTPDECLAIFAEHVRISPADAKVLADGWRCDNDWKASRRWYGQWLATQATRFKTEADAAIELLDSLSK